jgi:crotonobetainyl-CoA:carnitine CoA-transferase CaiB-like acyl-CoA transferase
MLSQPLSLYKVLDLSRVRAGPTAVRQLSDWGAQVIKIEMPKDDADDDNNETDRSDYQNMQRNKRSIAINLKHKDGVEILKQLVQTADIFIESFRPDVKYRLGIDYETLKQINPRLIYASLSGFGQTGPYQNRPGYDQVIQGMGGLMSVTGLPGQGPVRAGIPIADLSTGLLLANGILIALLERHSSGQGQWIETSLLASQIFMLDLQAVRYLIDGEIPPQAGNHHPTTIPTGTFRTLDGHINLAASDQASFRRLCKLLDVENLASLPDYLTREKRSINREKLNSELETIFSTKSTEYWITELNKASIACGPINRIDQTFADPQVQHLQITTHKEHPRRGSIELVGQPITMSRSQWSIHRLAPQCGEHTREILDELGYKTEQIDDLLTRHVIYISPLSVK